MKRFRNQSAVRGTPRFWNQIEFLGTSNHIDSDRKKMVLITRRHVRTQAHGDKPKLRFGASGEVKATAFAGDSRGFEIGATEERGLNILKIRNDVGKTHFRLKRDR